MEPTPFDEDVLVSRAAEMAGLEVFRRPVIDIDPSLLPATYMRKVPDYDKIRQHINQSIAVPGAVLTTRCEYVLRKPHTIEVSAMTLELRKQLVRQEQFGFLPFMARMKHAMRKKTGSNADYYAVLKAVGFSKSNDIQDRATARIVYQQLVRRLREIYAGRETVNAEVRM